MPAANYAELNTQIEQHFARADYRPVMDLAAEGIRRFPEDRPMLDYWRMCAAARLNDPVTTCRILAQSLASGFWYGEAVLRQSASFKPLQGLPEFENLIQVCRDRQTAAAVEPRLRTLAPVGVAPPPLLVALHGNQSTIHGTQPFWQPAVAEGWLVALPESTQMMWKGAHIWTEPEAARAEVLGHLAALREQASFDPARIVLGGHSMGGEIAIWLALTGALDARGFVVIGPGGPLCDEPENWKPIIAGNADRDLRGYFIAGGSDPLILPDRLRILLALLAESGLACALEEVPGAAHDPHPAYEAALRRGLAFVAGQ